MELLSATTLAFTDVTLEREFCEDSFNAKLASFDRRAAALSALLPLVVVWKECLHVLPCHVCTWINPWAHWDDSSDLPDGCDSFTERLALHLAVIGHVGLCLSHALVAALLPAFMTRHRTRLLVAVRMWYYLLLPVVLLPTRRVAMTCGFLRGCHLHNLVISLVFPATSVVPFSTHLSTAAFGMVVTAVLVSAPNGICAMLQRVAETSSACARMHGVLYRVGIRVHDVLWQYSAATGILISKGETGSDVRPCALATMGIHVTGLVAVTCLLYYREAKMRVTFLRQRGIFVVPGLTGLYTLRCLSSLVSIAVHCLLLYDALLG